VDKRIAALEGLLYENIFLQSTSLQLNRQYLLDELMAIRELMVTEHHSLFLDELDSFIHKVKLFGTHFATLDIRQNSRIHGEVMKAISDTIKGKSGIIILPEGYNELSEEEKVEALGRVKISVHSEQLEDVAKDTIATCKAIRQIQKANGEAGCHRYIISNCESAANVMEVYALLKLSGWEGDMSVDIVPLFETIDDLAAAEGIMELLYTNPIYSAHLAYRKKHQVIMLGFSDGTKDGGYLQANWSIYKAKERLTAISKKYEVEVTFFDGRGGPPSRGGGKTHQFYASMGSHIDSNEIQITIQGQTISSNFGTIISSQYNVEQLFSSGLSSEVSGPETTDLSAPQREVIDALAKKSHEAYQQFKGDKLFMPYLERMSPLNYYASSNIASRPSKRSDGGPLKFEDLRAIPFVGSWAQIKQNVPGYFGLGNAFEYFDKQGRLDEVKELYQKAPFFRALIDNSMMSMLKSFFPLTDYMATDTEFGGFRKQIEEEFERSKKYVLELSGSKALMQNDGASRESIRLREKIVLPLLTIQQYALQQLNTRTDMPADKKDMYEKLITRSMFGIINAARNSA
jgi:phosphoenolpyruvate carboxylase